MSFDSKKIEFDREHIYIVEIDLDQCDLTYGSSPCTASGSDKCFNTQHTCQDLANYDGSAVQTLRFCEDRSPQRIGLDAIPSIKSVSTSPAIIDIKGGLGVRSNVSIRLNDHPHSDIDIDPYLSTRGYDAFNQGTFWTKLRARNPNYQYRPLRLLSGYLNSDGSYSSSNFQTRYYLIERLDVSNGSAIITGKDPLKLASKGKAQAPTANTGLSTNNPLSSSATTLNVGSGEGAQYDTSGWILLKSEICSFTRSGDVFTIVRGQKNTTAVEHSSKTTVQQCLEFTGDPEGTLDYIINYLLVNHSLVDSSFIPSAAWATEVNTYSSGNLDGIITKPMDVNKILKELTEAIPHYLWWDEREQKIQLTILKAPPSSASVLDMDQELIADSVRVTDDVDQRVSTVFVNFGMFDPTKKLDEANNFQQSWIRIDSDSITKYNSNKVRVVNTRWLNNNNKAGAQKVATLIGRRFSDIPRKISFSLDAKDSDGATGLWVGQSRSINHRDIVDFYGSPEDTMFQILSSRERGNYDFTGLEFAYGAELAGDIASTDTIVYYSTDATAINLYDDWVALYGTPAADDECVFIVENNSTIGSYPGASAVETNNSWPSFTTGFVKLIINSGCYVVGHGGNGGHGSGSPSAANGGLAINLGVDLILEGGGVLGGGGGGGSEYSIPPVDCAGGGGAGSLYGLEQGGTAYYGSEHLNQIINAEDGTIESGGNGAEVTIGTGEPLTYWGGDGGDLGTNGTGGNGVNGIAGKACELNGYTLDQSGSGVTTYGTIS